MTDLAHALPLRRPAETPARRLHVVEAPAQRKRPKLAYGVIAVAGAVAIALAQMGLSILTTQGTYEVAALTQQQRDLTYDKQILYDDVAGLGSPQYLAANAAALGMVINESPSYLRLSDGAIIGTGHAAADASAVDAINRGAVPNALIADTPLVTAPDATIKGVPLVPDAATEATGGTGSTTPPPITDGLPTPATR
ncbi:hypothetical protein F6B41_00105 [Microbacterium lushaniae]|nr:hypothetical protein F6B41_33410 [Microbacterium lushaniae]KAA9159928.1 hypothetical protein F6B41_00105 [Microbacterium lushaniae]